jgi:hypothetical protein
VIAKETRTSKLIEISTEAVRAQQLERASAEELAQIDRVKTQAYARQENQTANTDPIELVSLPVSLLTPIARDLRATEGRRGKRSRFQDCLPWWLRRSTGGKLSRSIPGESRVQRPLYRSEARLGARREAFLPITTVQGVGLVGPIDDAGS